MYADENVITIKHKVLNEVKENWKKSGITLQAD